MDTNNMFSLTALVISAMALIASWGSRNAAKASNKVAILDRRLIVVHGLTSTAHAAFGELVDRNIYAWFLRHTLLAKELGFSSASLDYINQFRIKLERLKLLQAFEVGTRSENDNLEIESLKSWFFIQQREAINALSADIELVV